VAVVLTDGSYRVARRVHPATKDAHGTPVPGELGPFGPARAGASTEQPDGSWTLRLDPAEWPVWAGDEVEGPGSARWSVTGKPRLNSNPEAGDVDYVAVSATLRNVHV
jgi:hypothetical protein